MLEVEVFTVFSERYVRSRSIHYFQKAMLEVEVFTVFSESHVRSRSIISVIGCIFTGI
jgi:hypothetical protein